MSDVDVAWHDASVDADVALAGHVNRLMGRSGAVTSGRLCGACGSDRHGRPWLRYDGVVAHVSLARSGLHLVTAVASAPVGVDVEVAVIDVAPALVLATGEDEDLARTWARKEAVLKAYGTGLVISMADVNLDREHWQDLAAPDGFVAAVALAAAAEDDAGIETVNVQVTRREGWRTRCRWVPVALSRIGR